MALDATEGEQKLSYMESRREHLWNLLQIGMSKTDISTERGSVDNSESPPSKVNELEIEPPPQKKRQRKKPAAKTSPSENTTTPNPLDTGTAPKKKRTRKKTLATNTPDIAETVQEPTVPSTKKKPVKRVGQRKPYRDIVGDGSQLEV